MKNYYEILEVNKKASKEVIEKAYKVLVKKYHPDLYSGQKKNYAEEKIKEINEAYSVLTDEFMKEQYDAELEKQEQEDLYKKYNQKQNENTQRNMNSTNNVHRENKSHKSQQNNNEEAEDFNERMKRHKVGSFGGIVELCKELYKNKPKRDEMKEITKKDVIALILTIVVVILILVALWYIPFTNGWIRQLLFENSLFNAIAGLFK